MPSTRELVLVFIFVVPLPFPFQVSVGFWEPPRADDVMESGSGLQQDADPPPPPPFFNELGYSISLWSSTLSLAGLFTSSLSFLFFCRPGECLRSDGFMGMRRGGGGLWHSAPHSAHCLTVDRKIREGRGGGLCRQADGEMETN